jgi:hypothetical protein
MSMMLNRNTDRWPNPGEEDKAGDGLTSSNETLSLLMISCTSAAPALSSPSLESPALFASRSKVEEESCEGGKPQTGTAEEAEEMEGKE